MSFQLFTVVFPNGMTQYRTSASVPVLGDVLRHHGEDLIVERIGMDVAGNTFVTLRHPDLDGER